MIEISNKSDLVDSHIISLVSTALQQNELAGLSNMLMCVASTVQAYGCILWVAPVELEKLKDSSNQFLFVLAHWMQDSNVQVIHRLPIYPSATGEALLEQKIVNIGNIYEDARVFKDNQFFSQTGIKAMCSIPITLRHDVKGAINIYRTFAGKLENRELKQIEQILSLFPDLYQTISDKVSLSVIEKVNEYLHRAEIPEKPLSKQQVKNVLHNICKFITKSFQCLETSIFLEDRLEAPDLYEVMATTWPVKPLKKTTYRKGNNEGLTGWVLDNAKPVKIFDLEYFEETKEAIRRDYRGITWGDPLDIKFVVRDFHQTQFTPLSFIAAPILKGKDIRGVIRCCVTKKNPYYFTDVELRILELVAAQISRYWRNWLYRREMHEENVAWRAENDSWRALVKSIIKLNHFLHNELKNEPPDQARIFNHALELISSVIKGAEIMDVRLFDETERELYFASTFGAAWEEGDTRQTQARLRRRFPVDDIEQKSAGAEVFQTGTPRLIEDVATDPVYSATFPNIKRMLIVPISVEKEKYGVLDIRGTGEDTFPPYAIDIAELLGQQLGLYRYTAIHVGELKRVQKREKQIYQDLEHQLSHPVILAHARVQSVIKKLVDDEKLKELLQPIRGLCGKAMRVTLSTWLFIDISQNKTIQPKLKSLNYDELIKKLIEAADDNQLTIDPGRKIRFDVDRKSFEILKSLVVQVDYSLLEQCLGNLLDNAGKYSYDETIVRIYGGLTATRRFHISVSNKGIPIRHHEVKYCTQREWRGEQAQWVTSEGSGIGLWIVDNIMKAHGGDLIISPTTDKITDIKLVFPQAKSETKAL